MLLMPRRPVLWLWNSPSAGGTKKHTYRAHNSNMEYDLQKLLQIQQSFVIMCKLIGLLHIQDKEVSRKMGRERNLVICCSGTLLFCFMYCIIYK